MKKRIILLFLGLICSLVMGARDWNPAVEKEVLKASKIDTTASWYRSDRIYYEALDSTYNFGDFLNAIDLPTVFGVCFNPTGYEDGIGYYSQMYLEWRPYKTYGWLVMVSLDSHDQSYDFGNKGVAALNGWTPGVGAFVVGGKNEDVNVSKGTVFNMELALGGGYRIPLVPDIREYYAHPYVNKLNLSLAAQFGYDWSRLNHIITTTPVEYEVEDINYFHPIMKFSANFEYLTSPKFCIFAMATYVQHLTTMPWDNRDTHAGTLGVSIGFASFF